MQLSAGVLQTFQPGFSFSYLTKLLVGTWQQSQKISVFLLSAENLKPTDVGYSIKNAFNTVNIKY
jgi:hypothetical protein